MKKKNKKITFQKSTFSKTKINTRLKNAGVSLARDRKCLINLVKTVIGQEFDYLTLSNQLSANMPKFIYLKPKHGHDDWKYGGQVGCYYMPCDNPIQYKLPRGKSMLDYDLEEWDNLPTVEAGPQDIGIGFIKIKGRGLGKYRQETIHGGILQPDEKFVIRHRRFQVTEITIDFDFFCQGSRELRLKVQLGGDGRIYTAIEEVKYF